jgi:hypothetical protein
MDMNNKNFEQFFIVAIQMISFYVYWLTFFNLCARLPFFIVCVCVAMLVNVVFIYYE